MPTASQFRILVDQTLQIARLLLISYREGGPHATTGAEQQTLDRVIAILHDAYCEVYRLLGPAHARRGGARGVVIEPAGTSTPSVNIEADNDTSASCRRPRP